MTVDTLVQQLGDICHVQYTGCHKTDRSTDEWNYSYKDEIINLLNVPEARKAIESFITEARIDELESIGTSDGRAVYFTGRNAYGEIDIRERIAELKGQA